MFGYKAFILKDGKLTTQYGNRAIIYEIGQTYELNGKLELCKSGYHYCENLENIYKYYPYNSVIVNIEIPQDAYTHTDNDKSCANKIKLLKLMEGRYKSKFIELYYLYGQLHRLDGPAIHKYNLNGLNAMELYYINGKKHRVNGPAEIIYHSNGNKEYIEYRNNGLLHRLDGPAYIGYYSNGHIDYESYYKNGRLHRLNGPAGIGYDKNGQSRYEVYYVNGDLHRLNGPAIIKYYPDGRIESVEYWVNGVEK